MNILLVSATFAEIEPVLRILKQNADPARKFNSCSFKSHAIDVFITGSGMVQTAWNMAKATEKKKYELAINAGIAGSFNKGIPIGEVVSVKEDMLSEFGAEDDEKFIPAEELGIDAKSCFASSFFINSRLRSVRGITVNRVHGNEESIQNAILQFQPDIESMEGAAFFYACDQAGIKSLQIRAVSNVVEKRNRNKWNIPLAVENLNEELLIILDTL
jgi:futalosine hydrolase